VALGAAHPVASVIDPATGRFWEVGRELSGEFGETGRRAVRLPGAAPASPGRNTTLGVVATDAALTRVQALKVAQMAHDGLARAVRPAHTLFDGDTIFALGLGSRPLPATPGFFAGAQAAAVNEIGHGAADCVARAIIHAVLHARPAAGLIAFRDLSAR
jgi:L-aminopeptidase/D-esterase-like protein